MTCPDIVGGLSEPENPHDEDDLTPTEPPRQPSLPRNRRRTALRVVMVVVVLWALASAFLILSGARSANSAVNSLDSFTKEAGGDLVSLTNLVSDDADLSQLQNARDQLEQARGRLGSRLLAPLRPLPVIGPQLRSASALAEASFTITDSTLDAFGATGKVIRKQDDAAPGEAKIDARLTAAAEMQSVLETLKSRISNLDLGPTDGLLGPLVNARSDFQKRYDDATSKLDDAIAAVTGANSFLTGPNKYLILAANNGEMRAGSGMFLQIGVMSTAKGRFDLGDFTATAHMFLPTPGTTLDPTLQDLWGPLSPTQEWRNVNLTPRFDESARMATEMWQSSGRGSTTGAMAIDVVGLQELLKVSGPVAVIDDTGTETEISADNVVYKLLIDQYKALTDAGQEERRSYLGDVAAAIFESFNNGHVELADMLEAFRSIGKGRHLMMWSSDPVQQAGWEALGTSGKLAQDDMLLSVINRGGNKLDQFLDISTKLTERKTPQMRHLTAHVTIANNSPTGLPAYVEGPVAELDLAAGEYLGYLTLTVPGGAGNPTSKGAEIVGTAVDGPTKVIVLKVQIPRGQSLDIEVGFGLTTDWKSINVLSSARIPAVDWTAGARNWRDYEPKRVVLDELN